MFLANVRRGLQDPASQRVMRNVLFLGVGLALLIVAVFVVQTQRASSANLSAGAVVVDKQFPGKSKDDLGIGIVQAEKHFPGKEKDDAVTIGIAWEKRFPGKSKDDLGIGRFAAEKHFPGKDKDDQVTLP